MPGVVEDYVNVAVECVRDILDVVHGGEDVAEGGVVVGADVAFGYAEGALAIFGEYAGVVHRIVYMGHTLIVLVADNHGKCARVVALGARYVDIDDIRLVAALLFLGLAAAGCGELILAHCRERGHSHGDGAEIIVGIRRRRLIHLVAKLEAARQYAQGIVENTEFRLYHHLFPALGEVFGLAGRH